MPGISQSYSLGHHGAMVSIPFCGIHYIGSFTSQTRVQQGDPQGPFMFALVLHRMVTTIHTDEACAELLQNVWYLDDGSMAGEYSSVLRALTIILAQGPTLPRQCLPPHFGLYGEVGRRFSPSFC